MATQTVKLETPEARKVAFLAIQSCTAEILRLTHEWNNTTRNQERLGELRAMRAVLESMVV